MGGGQIRAPGRFGIFQHRPDVLLEELGLGLLLVTEGSGGQGIHDVEAGLCPGYDVPSVGSERHAPIHCDFQDLRGRGLTGIVAPLSVTISSCRNSPVWGVRRVMEDFWAETSILFRVSQSSSWWM